MADDGDAERLVVLLEARIRDFEKNMQKASGTADRSYAKMRQSSASATRQMEQDMLRSTSRINQALATTGSKIGSYGLAFARGIGGGMIAALAPMALFTSALEAINDASHLVDTADKIGITTKALQELSFGFGQAGTDAGTFESGMEVFSKRIGEAATKGGTLADILKANGVAIRDSNGQIRSSVDLLRSYADLVKNAASEQEKMVLVTEAFGRGAGDMLVGLQDGAAGIDKMGDAAKKAGVVIDDELLRRAEEMGDRWDAAWARFKVSAQSAILKGLEGIDSLAARMERFQKNQQAAVLGDVAGSLVGKPGDVLTGPGKGDKPNDIDVRIASAFSGQLQVADEKLVEQLKKRYGAAAGKATVIPGSKPPKGASASKSVPKTADDRLSEDIQTVRDRIAALQEEQATLGMSFEAQQKRKIALDLEQEALRQVREEARRKGDQDWKNAQLSPDQIAAIDAVSEAYAKQADQLRKAQDVQQLQRDLVQGALRDIRSALDDGKLDWTDAANIAINALDRIIDKIEGDLLDAIMDMNNAAGGASGGWLGSLLGLGGGGLNAFPAAPGGAGIGLYAKGTDNAPGGLSIVGEEGPELMNVPRGAKIIPHDRSKAILAGGGDQTNHFVFAPVVQSDGSEGSGEGVMKQIRKMWKAEFLPMLLTNLRVAKERGMLK